MDDHTPGEIQVVRAKDSVGWEAGEAGSRGQRVRASGTGIPEGTMGRTRISLTAALLHFFPRQEYGCKRTPPQPFHHSNSPFTLTDGSGSLDCFKGGLSLPPQPLWSLNPPPYQRASGSDLPLGDWARNWGLGKKEQRGPRKGPRLGRCHGVGCVQQGDPVPKQMGRQIDVLGLSCLGQHRPRVVDGRERKNLNPGGGKKGTVLERL